MRLSSFWSSIRGNRVKETTPPKKHVHPIYDQHATVPSSDAHRALRPSNAAADAPSIAQPSATYKQKRRSLWKPQEPDFIQVVHHVPSVPQQQTDKKAKRRSFWRAQSEHDVRRTKDIPLLERSNTTAAEEKQRKRRSFWRGESHNNDMTALPMAPSMGPAPAPDIGRHPDNNVATPAEKKERRLSRRMSSSSKASKRLSSIFGGRADEDSDDDVPAVPAIPHASLWERQRDQGRYYGMVDDEAPIPGTAITSDELYNTAATNHDAPSHSQEKRRSKRLSLHRNRSSTSGASIRTSTSTTKRKRRSWFAPGSSNPDDTEDDTPPLPNMPGLIHDDALTPSTDASDFERFLHTSHEAAQRRISQRMSQVPTDYERFMRESRAYDEALGGGDEHPAYTAHRSSKDLKQPRPKSMASVNKRSSYAGPRNAASGFLKTATETPASVRRSWRRSYGPGGRNEEAKRLNGASMVLSSEQQEEWDKLKHLMEVMEQRQDDGVFGMLRELEEDEDEEALVRRRKRERDEERGFGEGVYENRDALAALEYGMAR